MHSAFAYWTCPVIKRATYGSMEFKARPATFVLEHERMRIDEICMDSGRYYQRSTRERGELPRAQNLAISHLRDSSGFGFLGFSVRPKSKPKESLLLAQVHRKFSQVQLCPGRAPRANFHPQPVLGALTPRVALGRGHLPRPSLPTFFLAASGSIRRCSSRSRSRQSFTRPRRRPHRGVKRSPWPCKALRRRQEEPNSA